MILCCGEALIDMLPRRTPDGEPAFSPHSGGAVFNTAIALGRLGAPTGFLSGLSSDFFGDQLRERLAASGVDTAHAVISDRPTTLAFVRLVDGQASYAFYDENTAGRMLSADVLPSLSKDVAALFFGGISLIAEPCGSAYESLMIRESSRRVTMIDPNIRAGFVTDEAAYRRRLGRMLGVADIVKLSDEDLGWMEGAGDLGDLARQLLGRGPRLVMVTRGAEGVSAYTEHLEVAVPAASVEVVDTVGAGDTFNAGVLATLHERGLLTGQGLGELSEPALVAALEFGARTAAMTVSRPGADPPWKDELFPA